MKPLKPFKSFLRAIKRAGDPLDGKPVWVLGPVGANGKRLVQTMDRQQTFMVWNANLVPFRAPGGKFRSGK